MKANKSKVMPSPRASFITESILFQSQQGKDGDEVVQKPDNGTLSDCDVGARS